MVNQGRHVSHGVARNAYRHLACEAEKIAREAAKGDKPNTSRIEKLRQAHNKVCELEGGVEKVAANHYDGLLTAVQVRSVGRGRWSKAVPLLLLLHVIACRLRACRPSTKIQQ